MNQSRIERILIDHISTVNNSENNIKHVLPIMAKKISDAFSAGNKILICGNGGSAADAQHLAAEFVSAFSRNLDRKGLPAIALTVDTSILTAYSNDFSFEGVFSRQVEALGNPNDLLLVFSTSGNSKNCIAAVEMAKKMNIHTLGFTGNLGNLMNLVDICLCVESTNTQHIQEVHQVAYHALMVLIETQMFLGE